MSIKTLLSVVFGILTVCALRMVFKMIVFPVSCNAMI